MRLLLLGEPTQVFGVHRRSAPASRPAGRSRLGSSSRSSAFRRNAGLLMTTVVARSELLGLGRKMAAEPPSSGAAAKLNGGHRRTLTWCIVDCSVSGNTVVCLCAGSLEHPFALQNPHTHARPFRPQGCSGGGPAACIAGYECMDNWWPVQDECRPKGCLAVGCEWGYMCNRITAECMPTVRWCALR